MITSESLAMSVCGSISAASCLLVIITILSSPRIRKRNYNIVILYITICDFISSLGEAVGTSVDGSYKCYVQAIITNIFPLSSILWTMMIAFMIVSFLRPQNVKRVNVDVTISFKAYIFCCGVPLVLTFLPLLTNVFGCNRDDVCWCFLARTEQTPDWASKFWYIASFYLWIWGSLFIYIFVLVYVGHQFRNADQKAARNIQFIIRRLFGYPLVIAFCWVLPTIYDFKDVFVVNQTFVHSQEFNLASSVLPTLQGTLTAAVFFLSRVAYWSDESSTNSQTLVAQKPVAHVPIREQSVLDSATPSDIEMKSSEEGFVYSFETEYIDVHMTQLAQIE